MSALPPGQQFVGKWQLEESEGFEEYMKEVGVGLLLRKAAAALKLDIDISIAPDGTWHFHQTSTFKNHTVNFVLDKELDEVTPDGRQVKTVVHLEPDGTLVQTQRKIKASDKDSVITRKVDPDGQHLVVVLRSGDVSSRRVYRRVN